MDKDNNEIFINGRFLTQQTTGVQRYAQELVKALDGMLSDSNNPPALSYTLLSPRKIQHSLGLTNIAQRRIGLLGGHLWEQVELPLYTGTRPLLNLYTAPLAKKNQIVTLHDASVFEMPAAYSKTYARYYRTAFRMLCKRSRGMLTVSRFSRDSFSRFCSRPSGSIAVIYEGHEHITRVAADTDVFLRKAIDLLRPYIIVVGMTDRKNLDGIVQAAALLQKYRLSVLITGRADAHLVQPRASALPANVKTIGYVSDSELRALYENALCLLYPSFYEGFGLPPLEAMACGCPVVLSDIPVFKELYGSTALYCDAHAPRSIAAAALRFRRDPALRRRIGAEAQHCAANFSWQTSARQVHKAVQRFLL
ncbi:MAG: glycosyltransferase family 4 protein [Deltaproteobacteria bacterium]|nr:glycosyltransferase family 4 protein [Deltaproteobacteria bacterium]